MAVLLEQLGPAAKAAALRSLSIFVCNVKCIKVSCQTSTPALRFEATSLQAVESTLEDKRAAA